MKMIVAVVRDEFAVNLTEKLNRKGYSATKLASTGGFLKAGNTTFLIGVPGTQLDEVLGIVKETCHGSKAIAGGLSATEGSLKRAAAQAGQPVSSAVQVGGATVFVLDVEKMVKV